MLFLRLHVLQHVRAVKISFCVDEVVFPKVKSRVNLILSQYEVVKNNFPFGCCEPPKINWSL